MHTIHVFNSDEEVLSPSVQNIAILVGKPSEESTESREQYLMFDLKEDADEMAASIGQIDPVNADRIRVCSWNLVGVTDVPRPESTIKDDADLDEPLGDPQADTCGEEVCESCQ